MYTIRLYEILKSYEKLGIWTFNIDDLKKKLDAESYERFPDFRRRIIDPALEQINKYADFFVDREFIKTGQKYTDIILRFRPKTATEHYNSIKAINDKLAASK